MKLYTMFLAVSKDKAGKPISDIEATMAVGAVKAMIAKEFGGYSNEHIVGGYTYDNGKVVEENSERFEVLVPDGKDAFMKVVAGKARDLLRQESVLLTSQPVNSEFI